MAEDTNSLAAKMPQADPSLLNPLDSTSAQPGNDGSDLLKSIVQTETGEAEKSILGEAPELDMSLLRDMTPKKSVFLLVLKILFGILLVSGLAAFLFFTSQLTKTFDFISSKIGVPNISQDLASSNSEIINLQTDLNFNRYLQIKAQLDKFSFEGDSYLKNFTVSNSQTASDSEKKKAKKEVAKIRKDLKASFDKAKERYVLTFSSPIIDQEFQDTAKLDSMYQEKLTTLLNEKAATIANNTDAQSKSDNKNYIQTLKLVGNVELKNLMVQTDFDKLSEAQLADLVSKINGLIVNDLSIIQQIKSKRIKWSDIINEITLRTIAVDSHYSEKLYEDYGGIRYTSYDFDSEARTIAIIGEIKRFGNADNFTMIADLVDELNQSKLFKNGEMRSFSKSGSAEDGYTATLKLSLDLRDEVEIVDGSAQIDKAPEFLNK